MVSKLPKFQNISKMFRNRIPYLRPNIRRRQDNCCQKMLKKIFRNKKCLKKSCQKKSCKTKKTILKTKYILDVLVVAGVDEIAVWTWNKLGADVVDAVVAVLVAGVKENPDLKWYFTNWRKKN